MFLVNANVFAMMQGSVLKVGQAVQPGDIVGIMGNTGRSTGEHLHITARHKGEYINPQIFLDYIISVQESCLTELTQMDSAHRSLDAIHIHKHTRHL